MSGKERIRFWEQPLSLAMPERCSERSPWLSLDTSGSKHSKGMIKAIILTGFIALAIYVIRFTPVKEFLTREVLGQLLNVVGIWAPFIFLLVYAVGVCLFFPGTLITA